MDNEEIWREFLGALQGCDTVYVTLTGVGETKFSTQEVYNAIQWALNEERNINKM